MNARLKKLGLSGSALRRIAGQSKHASVYQHIQDMVDECRELLGDPVLVDELISAMGPEEAQENLEFILHQHGYDE